MYKYKSDSKYKYKYKYGMSGQQGINMNLAQI